jgi:hypothetical protein
MDWDCLSSALSSNTSLSAPLGSPADIVKPFVLPCVNGYVWSGFPASKERTGESTDLKRRAGGQRQVPTELAITAPGEVVQAALVKAAVFGAGQIYINIYMKDGWFPTCRRIFMSKARAGGGMRYW